MKWSQPTRADHDAFCRKEGWTRVPTARGTKGTDHLVYELTMADGSVLRTKISHPPNRTDYGAGLWQRILKDQLQVTEAEFWACVRDGVPPVRGELTSSHERSIPVGVVYHLIHTFVLSEEEVASMTRDEAISKLQALWAEKGSGSGIE